MAAMGQIVDSKDDAQTTLYLRLTCEEFGEALCAANPSKTEQIEALLELLTPLAEVAPDCDRVKLFDGLIDTVVTTVGAGVSARFPMTAGWDEVYRTNIAKIDPETGCVTRRADGKVLKPEGWQEPNLRRVLNEEGV